MLYTLDHNEYLMRYKVNDKKNKFNDDLTLNYLAHNGVDFWV